MATYLNKTYGVASVGYYLVIVCIISLIAIRLMPETRGADMTEI